VVVTWLHHLALSFAFPELILQLGNGYHHPNSLFVCRRKIQAKVAREGRLLADLITSLYTEYKYGVSRVTESLGFHKTAHLQMAVGGRVATWRGPSVRKNTGSCRHSHFAMKARYHHLGMHFRTSVNRTAG
jgi:hypothetical protein